MGLLSFLIPDRNKQIELKEQESWRVEWEVHQGCCYKQTRFKSFISEKDASLFSQSLIDAFKLIQQEFNHPTIHKN